jgi:D-amino-acid oxidase
MPPSVAVIGAGVSGLTCSVLLAEAGYGTVIFAGETGQETTSAAAAAIWFPYDAEPVDKIIPWALETYRTLVALADDKISGVSMIELRTFSRTAGIQIPDWADGLGARHLPLSGQEVKPPGLGDIFRSGFTVDVPLTNTTIYLDYLAQRFADAGGRVHGGVHFENVEEVSRDFDLVVNCSGIGARKLAADSGLEPHRGQVVIVPKQDLACAIVCDDAPLMYAIPRDNDCVFGGSNEVSADREANFETTVRILSECSRVLKIEPPKILGERVGLRPYRRAGVRLERGQLKDGRAVIHNYGHGGSGFTLSWGCAREVRDLISIFA